MPNLRPTLTATWRDGALRLTIRIHISKPRLVTRPIQVRVRIPALGETRNLTVRANGKSVRGLHLVLPASASVVGTRVIVRLDSGKRIVEAGRKDTTAAVRIT